MKLLIKTLQQQSFNIEIEPTETISSLKTKIQEAQGFPAAQQKLIHSGKILAPDAILKDCNIQEKDFLVVMVTKPKATPAIAVPAVETPQTITPTMPAVPANTPTNPPLASPAPAAPVAAPVPANAFDSSTLATGNAYESAVNNLVEMGFEKALVQKAMRAAFNNPDRAAEYLMTGIPESIARDMTPAVPAGANTPNAPQATPVAAATAAPTGNQPFNMFEAAANQARATAASAAPQQSIDPTSQLAMLRNSSQFQQLRQLVQAQPELLQPLLQQLGQSSPELLQLINSNPEQFLQILNEEQGDFEEGETEGQYITISPQDDEAITRLTNLGFDRNQAAEAFIACDKNEELAANYLFDQQMGGDF